MCANDFRDFEKYQNLYFKFYITITMLNKGFRFFGQGSSKKFQVSSQRSPWPNILSMIGDLIKVLLRLAPLDLTFRPQELLEPTS